MRSHFHGGATRLNFTLAVAGGPLRNLNVLGGRPCEGFTEALADRDKIERCAASRSNLGLGLELQEDLAGDINGIGAICQAAIRAILQHLAALATTEAELARDTAVSRSGCEPP